MRADDLDHRQVEALVGVDAVPQLAVVGGPADIGVVGRLGSAQVCETPDEQAADAAAGCCLAYTA